MLVHQGLPQALNSPVPIYTPDRSVTVREQCHAQEQNTMLLAGTQTQTSRSIGKHTNHEVPQLQRESEKKQINLKVPYLLLSLSAFSHF